MKRFKKIYTEITNICNMKCPYCPGSKRAYEYIAPQRFEKLLSDISPYTDYVYLHVMGEPLIHPELKELLTLCSAYNLNVNITTNGLNLAKVSEVLLNSDRVRQINISLHSYAHCTNHDAWLTDLIAFARLAAARSVYINFRLWSINSGDTVAGEMLEEAHNKYILDTLTKSFNLMHDALPLTISKAPHGISLAKNIYLHLSKRFVWPDINGKEIFLHGRCYGLRDHVGILVDGTVVPCCLDGSGAIPLGNIYETPFSDIINSNHAQDIINGFRCGRVVEDFCKTCGFAHVFCNPNKHVQSKKETNEHVHISIDKVLLT